MQAIGPYRVLSHIGTGGMGEVYLAEDTRLHRKVALKALRPSVADGEAGRARVMREARAIAALNHPHVAAIYDVVEDESSSQAVIVMEYVPGETLSDRIRRGRLPVGDTLTIAVQVAQALAAAHGHGVIHRDLKPANVRLTPDGQVKVLDFGLARTAPEAPEATLPTSDVPNTIAGHVVGTPGYMSPEQLRGLPVDRRTDLYSLGILIFEAIAGHRPFGGDLITAGLAALTQPTPHLRDADSAVPPSLDALVARLMAVHPDARPSDAAEVERELAAIRAAVASGAAVVPPARIARRSRALEYAGVAIVVLIAVAAAGVLTRRTSTRSTAVVRPVIAVMPLTNLSGDASKDYLGIGIADTLATHLARVRSVSVVDPTAAAGAKKTTDPAAIARELGATLLLQGSVQEQGDRLRVSAKLVKPDGVVAWAGDSDAAASDLFALESRLANAMINALEVSVSAAERVEATRAPTSSPQALDELMRAASLMERTDPASLSAAIAALKRAIADDPGFALAHARLGEAYRREWVNTNDRDWITQAVAETSRAVELDPTSADAHMVLASVLNLTGRSGAAMDELRQVLAQQPSNDTAHRQLAEILSKQGKPEEARLEYQRAIDIRPDYWRSYEALGLFLLDSGRSADAAAAFSRVVALQPDNGNGYQQLGTAYQMLGDTARARENYRRALEIYPNAQAYSNLGTLEYSNGRYTDAAAAYERAVQLLPKRPIGHRNLGDAYAKLGRTADARREYQLAIQLTEELLAVNPTDAANTARLAIYEAKLGRAAAARRHIESAERLNPGNADILYRTAVVYALLNDPGHAMKALTAALDRGYSPALARGDDDLKSLAALPDFRRRVGVR